jgi:POT family proton-dependent oligopeptide transporter
VLLDAVKGFYMLKVNAPKFGFWDMPKAFYAIIFIEFWERFAFYGMQAVAVLFLIKQFNLTEAQATDLFSSFSALLYALLVIGGYLGDKVLGLRRTYLLGIIFLMCGYASFSLVATANYLYFAMGMILVGNIFFKTNAGNYVNRCFKVTDPCFDAAFTYFYMAINLGSFFSMIITPLIAQKTSYAFAISVCGGGMFIAWISYWFWRKSFQYQDNSVGQQSSNKFILSLGIALLGIISAYVLGQLLQDSAWSKIILFSVAGGVFIILFMLRQRLITIERQGLELAFILLLQSIFFWLMYMQMATSLTLFALHNVRKEVFGITIPPEVTQCFNPFYIFLFSPFLAQLYIRSEHQGKPISIPAKFAWGMMLCGLAYILLSISCFFNDEHGTIALIWLFLAYGLYSLGELLISAIGLSMVSKLMPLRLGGFAQAIWFVTTAIGMKLGGMAANFATVNPQDLSNNLLLLQRYQILFAYIGAAALIFAVLLLLLVKPLAQRISWVLKTKVG